MSVDKYKEWILNTIDQLRRRKARPHLDRICHMVQRKYGLNSIETKAYIEKLVDAEIVIKVDYKGNTSYRNAAKLRKRRLGGQILNSFTASKMLVDAVKALTQGLGGDGALKGASIRDIERWLVSQNLDRDELKCPLHVMLQREVDAGQLEKLPNGNYTVSQHGSKAGKMKAMMLKRCLSNPSKRGRPPKKKKMKRFYSYEPETAAPASPPPLVVKIPAPICDYCQHSANKSGEHEELLFCKDCNAKAHPTCMEYSAVLAHRARMYPWQCIDCKTCNLCKDAGDADSMLFCDACDKGFHMNCHKPQVTEKPSGKWICFECSQQGIKTSDIDSSNPTENSSSVRLLTNGTQHTTALGLSTTAADLPITPCDSPVSELDHKSKRLAANSLPAVPSPSLPKLSSYTLEGAHYPDASSWSIEDVGSFFESIGFSDQADAFREQEIDGQSLLLMKRSDVLTGLSIKLGPALKLYQHVIKLQTAGLENSLFC